MKQSQNRGALLVGSGISIPGGYPSVADLTSTVLTGTGAFKHTDDSYYIDAARRQGCPHVGKVLAALRKLKEAIDPALRQYQYSGREANYEDLVYVARQLGDFALGEIENPVVGPFLQHLQSEMTDLFDADDAINGHHGSFGRLMRETEKYVRDIVWRSLETGAHTAGHLRVFLEALQDRTSRRISIGTLNHDTLLERYLADAGVRVWDGFGQTICNVRYWSRTEITSDDEQVFLLKLHGSVDWFEFRPDNGDLYDDKIGIPGSEDFWHTLAPGGHRQMPVSGRPLMLVGTFNKYIDYAGELFSTIHSQWRAKLSASDRLVICGYGFGDRGINTQIIEWMYGNRDRKMLVVNPDIDNLKCRCRGAIRSKWDKWVDAGALEVVDSRVQDVGTGVVAGFLST